MTENVKEATTIFSEITVSERQLEIGKRFNSIIRFKLSDTALDEIDEIINR